MGCTPGYATWVTGYVLRVTRGMVSNGQSAIANPNSKILSSVFGYLSSESHRGSFRLKEKTTHSLAALYQAFLAMMAFAGIRPVALAETMLPATPGPSPATYMPLILVSRSLVVSTWVAKNLISGA